MSLKELRYREKLICRRKNFRRIVLLTILSLLLLWKEPGASGNVVQRQQKDGRKSGEKDLAVLKKDLKETKQEGMTTPDPKNITALLELLDLRDETRQLKDSGGGLKKLGNETGNNTYEVKNAKSYFVPFLVTTLVGFFMVSAYMAHYFYEKQKLLKPLQTKVIKMEGDLWKATMALNGHQDDFDSTKESNKIALTEANEKLRKVEAELELAKDTDRVQKGQLIDMKSELVRSKEEMENDKKLFEKQMIESKEEVIQRNKDYELTSSKLKSDFEKELSDLKILNENLDNSLKMEQRLMGHEIIQLNLHLNNVVKSELRKEREKLNLLKVEAEENLTEKNNLENDVAQLKETVKQCKAREKELLQELESEKSRHLQPPPAVIVEEEEEKVPPPEQEKCFKEKTTFGRNIRKRVSSCFGGKNKRAKEEIKGTWKNEDKTGPGPDGDVLKVGPAPKSKKWFWKKKVVRGGTPQGEG